MSLTLHHNASAFEKIEITCTREGLLISFGSLASSVQNNFNFDEGGQWSLITIRCLGVTEVQNQSNQLMYWFGLCVKEINKFEKDLIIKKE